MKQGFVVIMIFILYTSCRNSQQSETRISSDTLINQLDTIQDITPSSLSPILQKKMNNFLTQGNLGSSDKIITVSINKEGSSCYVKMITQPFYFKKYVTGHILMNDKLVVFYKIDEDCNKGMVKVNELATDSIADFPDESIRHTIGGYEPYGRKYKIYAEDSLELVLVDIFSFPTPSLASRKRVLCIRHPANMRDQPEPEPLAYKK